MDKESKELLLTDLCARLPYGVMVHWNGEHELVKLYMIKHYGYIDDYIINGLGQPEPGYEFDMRLNDILPYLRPMLDMTEEEKLQLVQYACIGEDMNGEFIDEVQRKDCHKYIDWLNAHHFDFRNLIDKGLALEAPDGMYKL